MHENKSPLPSGVNGHAADGFEGVVRAFQSGVVDPTRTGAALSIWRNGLEVVDIWSGTADHRIGRAWEQDTLNVIFSCSKGLSTLVLARLHETGKLDLLAPISEIWPEFAAHGKGRIAVADVLAHRAGVSVPPKHLTREDALNSHRFAEVIATQEPLWQPGAGHTYHAITFGTIVQELVRRVTGRELHDLFSEEIAYPLGADLTLKADKADLVRLSHIEPTSAWRLDRTNGTPEHDELIGRALSLNGILPRHLADEDEGFNDPEVVAAGVAGAGGVGTASSLARIWSATILPTDGMRLVSDDTIRLLTRARSEGRWVFDPGPPYHRFGTGVQLSSAVTPWLSRKSFGHDGAGGQSGFADATLGVSLGYVTNRMDTADRVARIIEPLHEALLIS